MLEKFDKTMEKEESEVLICRYKGRQMNRKQRADKIGIFNRLT